MKLILDYNKQELAEQFTTYKQPAFRLKQILEWTYHKAVDSFDKMSNLPGSLREMLSRDFSLRSAELVEVTVSADGTKKLLLRWFDGSLTETILMQQDDRRTVCVSTQVGCPVRCSFCASGLDGLERSLTSGEIVEQIFWAAAQLPPGERISNVVIMGMGEPFANYDNTVKALAAINGDWGLNIGARRITVSTVGIPDRIMQFAYEPFQVTLAVSLHAGDDELRARLVPWAKQYSLKDIFDAIDIYFQVTYREVTLEYTMLERVNCRSRDAENLAKWVNAGRCNVNLINYNSVEDCGFIPASKQTVNKFAAQLKSRGVNVNIRKSKGAGINAACGQLRQKHK